MPLDIKRFKSLPEKEQRSWIEKLESSHREERKNLENIQKMCNVYLADEKNSAKDIATILEHRKNVMEAIKNIEDDMNKISSFMYYHGHGGHHHHKGNKKWRTFRMDKDAVAAVKAIIGSGGVNIRPGEIRQPSGGALKTFKVITEERRTNIEAAQRTKLAALLNELNRSTKKDEFLEKKEDKDKEKEREREREREQKAKGAQ